MPDDEEYTYRETFTSIEPVPREFIESEDDLTNTENTDMLLLSA